MAGVHSLNPFAKRETHDARSLLVYKILTILTWLLVLISSVYYSVDGAYGGHGHHHSGIWRQNKLHPTPFSLNPFITDIYWIILLILQLGYVYQLFQSNAEVRTAAANVGSHFIISNLLQFAFIMLWVTSHFWIAELILIINFFNLTTLYFRHPYTNRLAHAAVTAGPLAWTYVAIFLTGAAMVGATSLAARIVANVFVWSFLGFGLSFLVAFQDYILGFAMSILTASLAVHQFNKKHFALQWIFAIAIASTLFIATLGIAIPKYFGKDVTFKRSDNGILPDTERQPLLSE